MFYFRKAKDYFFKTKKNLTSKQNILITFAKKYFFMAENDKKEYRNWYKALLRIQKKELILFGVLILLAFIFIGISETAYEWFKIIKIYYVLDNKPLINIPICIIISGFAIWWWIKIWKDKDIRPYRLGIIAFGLIVFIFIDGFLYANIVCNFSYQWFFIGLLAISAIIIITKFIIYNFFTRSIILKFISKHKCLLNCYLSKNRFKRSRNIVKLRQKEPELNGFSVDNTKIKLEDNQIKYAETLVKKLKNTDLSKESFAVGITGEWGSGKSTFLNTMKEEIDKAKFAEIVEFNPWLCNSPEQVTQDFFATLIDKLSPKHSTLSRDINKYAKLLNKIAKPSLSFFGIDLDLTPNDDSLDKLKDKISKKLEKLPKKVVILIDDTDRLEGNEVFEILRLIRNTADFKNVIYIATYDKEYVTDVLEGNKIKDPDNYLEKIFQVEVPLLKVIDYKLWAHFTEIISKQDISVNKYFTNKISNLYYRERELILNILYNYRRLERFVEYYMFNINYVLKNISRLEVKQFDLLWIELLQFYDQKTYNVLKNEPEKILLKDKNRYYILNGISKNENNVKRGKFEDTPFWKPLTPNILEQIFGTHIKTLGQSICYIESYEKYFTLNLSNFKLSVEEFRKIFTSNDNAKQLIAEWTKNKSYESILHNFNLPYINGIDQPCYNNYLYGLFELSKFAVENSKQFPTNCYETRFYDTSLRDEATKTIKKAIEEKINEIDTLDKDKANTLILNLSKFLKKIFKIYFIDDNNVPMECYTMIITNKDIIEFIKTLVNKYFAINKEHSAKDVVNNNSNLCKLLKNCCVVEEDSLKYGDGDEISTQIASDIIIKHFQNKKNKPTIEELYNTLYDNFPQKDEFEDGYEQSAYDSFYYEEKADDLIRDIFGGKFGKQTFSYNPNDSSFKIFKEKCFKQN